MEDNIVTTTTDGKGAAESMLAQMLVQPHLAPEEVYSSLTNEQLRAMSSFDAPSSPYMPDLIRNTLTEQTRMPQTPPLPGWVETNPLRLTEDTTIQRNIEWAEELKRREEALKRNTAERAFREHFTRHVSAAMVGKSAVAGPEQLNNGEITMTTSHNPGNLAANLRYSQEHRSKAVLPRLPAPPPPVPDVTISAVPNVTISVIPNAKISTVPNGAISAVARPAPSGLSISAFTSSSEATPVISPAITSVRTLPEAPGSYVGPVAAAPTPAPISPVITSVCTLSEAVAPPRNVPLPPLVSPVRSPAATSLCTLSDVRSTYASLVAVAPATVSPAPPTPSRVSPIITSVCTLADEPAGYASLVDASPAPGVITSTPSVVTYPSARLLKMKHRDSTTPVVNTAAAPVPAPAACGVAPSEEPYGDNQLLVEVENPDRRKRRSTKRPRLISESGSYVCMEDWEEMVGDDGGEAPEGREPDYNPGAKRSKKGPRGRPRTAARDSAGSADRRRTRQSFKQRLLAQMRADSGRELKSEEVEEMFLGPEYAPETLEDSELLHEFVQLVVTKVYSLPCSALLLAALQPHNGGCAAPAEYFTDLIRKTRFPKAPTVHVAHAACLPEQSPFKHHVFTAPDTKLEEPKESMRLLYEKIESMTAVREAVTEAAERFRQQLEVVKAFLMPPAVAPRPPGAGSVTSPRGSSTPSAPRPRPRPRAGPRSVTRRLAARLPVTTTDHFLQLDRDLNEDPALRMELLDMYRDVTSQSATCWECVRGCMARTLAPPVDAAYSGSGRAYGGVAKANYSATAAYRCLEEAMSERFGDQENREKLRNQVGKWLCYKKDQPHSS